MNLSNKKCTPCQAGAPTLTYPEIKKLSESTPTWRVVEEYKIKRLVKDFKFEDFSAAMKFVNQVAEIAETEGHHPNIWIHDWNKVRMELYTHKINGLHENDFILAAKIDTIKE